jgi:hypothetical protein
MLASTYKYNCLVSYTWPWLANSLTDRYILFSGVFLPLPGVRQIVYILERIRLIEGNAKCMRHLKKIDL